MLAHKGDKYINSQRFLKIIVNFYKVLGCSSEGWKKGCAAAEACLRDKEWEDYIEQLSQTSCIHLWMKLFSFTEINQTSVVETQNAQMQQVK